ncbi:MAG TPA: chloride channel protein [Acidimicrobiia bacterium]
MLPPPSERRSGDRLRWIAVVAATMVLLGAIGALATVGFIKLLEWLIDLVWKDLPDAIGADAGNWEFILPVCTIGGLVAGLCARFLGEWPKDLQSALADFRRDRAFDYRHLPNSMVTALAALTFGAALGPEAALVALVGGLASWISRVIGVGARAAVSLDYVGVVAALGTLFGTAGAALLPLDEGEVRRQPRRLVVVALGVVAAGAGALTFSVLSPGDEYFDYTFRPYDFAVTDLLWAAAATVAGALAAVAYLLVKKAVEIRAARLATRPVVRATVGGVVLGVLASVSALVLFSGHDGIQTLIDDTDASALYLVGIALAKLSATALLLATGWRGGRFFPLMFAGAGAGLAFAAMLPEDVSMVALAGAMTAAIAVLIRRPLAAGLLMLFVFPHDLYPTVVVATLLGTALGHVLVRRLPALDPVEA